MGYHLRKIQKGKLGEFSKIQEEFEELEDAYKQNNSVLMICECCDLLGAIEAFMGKYNLSLDDLEQMKECTRQAFEEGTR